MFSGIIESKGQVKRIERFDRDCRMTIETGNLSLEEARIGDSIAVNGVCLTAITLSKHQFSADVSFETLSCTTLSSCREGEAVNLERALSVSDRLNGHIVSGHVDGVAALINRVDDGQSIRLSFDAPQALQRYIAVKGSVTVNGISLTVNEVNEQGFGVNIVPHTAKVTTLGDIQCGDKVNIEVDILARYMERLMTFEEGQQKQTLNTAFLAKHGYIKP